MKVHAVTRGRLVWQWKSPSIARSHRRTFIVSAMLAGCIAGAFASEPLAEKYGRKGSTLVSAVFNGLGMATMAHAPAGRSGVLLAGRVICGIGVLLMTTVHFSFNKAVVQSEMGS